MEDFRSKSYGHGRMQNQIEPYSCSETTASSSSSSSTVVRDMRDLRCYSASHASSVVVAYPTQTQMGNGDVNFKFKKGRSTNSSSSKSWSLADPELQRKKRVASYRVYAVEGKLKGSMRRSFKWLKDKYTRVVHGL